ncbi:hypothetical protein DC28_04130 [Spirochaeta lutea]|uniref:Hemolysin III n=2 Tax=Spirochaeta lutea TaxID=1480694 RepID=A0A098R0S5_9SPIO|nr:hypothetical protein DC28_04130 [Spirochaeta lutea]
MEEIFNSLTHAIGAGLSIAGLVVLLIVTGENPDPWKYVSFSIYGTTQIILYLSSALLHGFADFPRIRQRLERLDHGAIYLLIAGTYTPLSLVILRGAAGWWLFGVVWAIAIIGLCMKLFVMKKLPLIVDALYLPMGWLIVFVLGPFLRQSPPGFILWAVIGGLSYSLGFIFYAWRSLRFAHVIWHLFVLAGSVSFYLGYAMYVAR